MLKKYLNPAAFSQYNFLIRTSASCFTRNLASLSLQQIHTLTNRRKCLTLHDQRCSNSKGLISTPLFSNIPHTRSKSFQANSEKEKMSLENYVELYLINDLRFYRLLCRFSKYSFYTFLLGSPLCIALSFLDIFPIEQLRIAFSVLTFYTMIFTGQSFLITSRIVAKIMVSPDSDMVKLSHLSVFGDRRDIYLKPSDIIKMHSFGPEAMAKTFVTLKFQTPSTKRKSLIFLPGHGGVSTNYEALEYIFFSDSKGDKQ